MKVSNSETFWIKMRWKVFALSKCHLSQYSIVHFYRDKTLFQKLIFCDMFTGRLRSEIPETIVSFWSYLAMFMGTIYEVPFIVYRIFKIIPNPPEIDALRGHQVGRADPGAQRRRQRFRTHRSWMWVNWSTQTDVLRFLIGKIIIILDSDGVEIMPRKEWYFWNKIF